VKGEGAPFEREREEGKRGEDRRRGGQVRGRGRKRVGVHKETKEQEEKR